MSYALSDAGLTGIYYDLGALINGNMGSAMNYLEKKDGAAPERSEMIVDLWLQDFEDATLGGVTHSAAINKYVPIGAGKYYAYVTVIWGPQGDCVVFFADQLAYVVRKPGAAFHAHLAERRMPSLRDWTTAFKD